MSYLVIARKFRPQSFDSISGQEHVTKALANAIVMERIPHALLFTGPRGVGKTSCARVFAKALNCQNSPHFQGTLKEILEGASEEVDAQKARTLIEPCGECINCKGISQSSSLAVREIDGASNNSVDNVRELIESLRSLPPDGSKYKIYIIDEVHMLSTAAFNALLKSLEEPPPNTIFVFATTEPHKIPETVISRCQRHDFRALSEELICSQLAFIAQKEKVNVADDVIALIARKAQGGMRDAQSMFDRLLAFSTDDVDLPTAQALFGIVDSDLLFSISGAVFAQDVSQCFENLARAFALSIDIKALVSDFLTHWRNLLVLKLTMEGKANISDEKLCKIIGVSSEELSRLQVQVAEKSSFDLTRLFDIAETTANRALVSNYPRYVFEAGLAKMSTLESLRPLPELISRLESLEKGGTGVVIRPSVAPQTSSSSSAERINKKDSNNSVPKEQPPALAQPVTSVEETFPDAGNAEFNPSWQDFVSHVKSRSELILSAHLRRVSPVTFRLGELTLEAGKFDIECISAKESLEVLRGCLFSYSQHESWKLKFVQHSASAVDSASAANSGSPKANTEAKREPVLVEGSLVHKEVNKERVRESKIDAEAREHPSVKAALSTFDGSKIEKVSVLKP